MESEYVKDKIIAELKNLKIVFIMVLIFVVLWPVNRNLSFVVSIYTGLFIVFVGCIISVLKTIRSDTEVPVSSVVVVMVYSFLLLVPTIKLYSDLPDYFNDNWLVEEGKIEKTIYRRGYKDVYINNECITFWDPTTSFKNIPHDTIVRIYYLPRSKHGIEYELVKNQV